MCRFMFCAVLFFFCMKDSHWREAICMRRVRVALHSETHADISQAAAHRYRRRHLTNWSLLLSPCPIVHVSTAFFFHSGEKPFMCEACGKSFASKEYLRHHSNIHTGSRPYKCEQCGRSFAQRNSLHQHLKIHTGAK